MDEEADLALLDQHLLKTNLLSQRMTGILGQLDTRLSRLDKAIAPLGIQPLTRKANNIDAILQVLSPSHPPASASTRPIPSSRTTSSSSHATLKGYSLDLPASTLTPIVSAPGTATGTPADETAILTRGPDIMALTEYFSALDSVISDLERMWKGYTEGRGGARETGVRDLSKLVEIGFSGMTDLFLKISREGMGRTFDPDQLLESGAPTPPNFFVPLNTLLPLTSHITDILNPRKSTPKTSSIIEPIMENATSAFAEMRGEWIKRSLSGMMTRVEEVDEGGIWEGDRGREKVKGLIGLCEVVIVVAEVSMAETLLITTLFPQDPPPTLLQQTLLAPIGLVTSVLQPTLNTIKRRLSSHVFVALDLYQSLIRTSQNWETSLTKCLSMTHSSSSPELLNIFSGPISTLRGLCLRSFPELLVDIRSAPTTGPPTSAISDITYSTLTYLETLPAYEKIVEGLLGSAHAERSWLMGAKDLPSPVKSASDEGGIVNLYVADVLGTVVLYLEQRAKSMRKLVGQAFLLNNLSHMRNTTSSFTSDLIGPGAEDMLNRSFRDAKAGYLSEFSSLVSLLNPSTPSSRFNVPGTSSERSTLKEAAVTFFDKLDQMESLTSQNPLSRQDVDLRDRVGREAGDIVGRGWDGFWKRCEGKGLEKYLKGTPDDIQKRVTAMFR
ncbi:Cullin repeat-like-containing domain protein [Naematelia encephala]|uniref:Exocyst complex protein EXO70 n=1 Tax=Naematelia encephala TaxID=71784 RepID=A0A1Y2AX64_9TREE|nr:Cullin repeat-like-containing domain protein [Naematelia encephala]